jgi:ATP-binding cassette, subfamily B, multidrug efflux pump
MMGMDGGRRFFDQENSKPKNLAVTLGRFVPYFRRYWIGLVAVVFLIVANTYVQVVAPDITGQVIDCYLFTIPDSPTCWLDSLPSSELSDQAIMDWRLSGLARASLLLVGLFVAGAVMQGAAAYMVNWTGMHALRDIRRKLFQHLHKLSLGFYSENEAGDVMSRVTSDSDTIQQAIGFPLLSIISAPLLMVWIAVKMFQTNVPYALLSLLIVPFMVIATVYFSTQARKAFRKSRAEMGSVNADLQESIAGVREVQAFNREDENISNFEKTNAANRDANVRAAVFTSALNPVLEALGYVALAIVIIVGGVSVLRNEPLLGTSIISLGTVFAFLQYIQRFTQPIQQVALLWTNVQSAIAGGERIFNLMDKTPDIVDKPNAAQMPEIKGHVELVDAAAEYKKGQPVLKGVSLEAKPGEMIAIVGPTGAGKTTIINLIPRFYDVTSGAVKIDGYDVRDVTAESLRKQIGIVLQDSFLFSDTVMNNIRYGRLDATDEEVIAAAKLVYADGFIERLQDGYQTVLGERGSGLSQGQRQLLSIARAALANPRILILDEATSSVDTRTERLIQKALDNLLAGRTSFVIAHRLSTVRNASKILVLKAGEVVESGTHNELLSRQGAYYDLYMSQFRRQEEQSGTSPNTGAAFAPQPAGD